MESKEISLFDIFDDNTVMHTSIFNVLKNLIEFTNSAAIVWDKDNKSSTSYKCEIDGIKFEVSISHDLFGLATLKIFNSKDSTGINIINAVIGTKLNKKIIKLYEAIYCIELNEGIDNMLKEIRPTNG